MTSRFTVSPDVCSSSDKDGSTILSVEKGRLYSIIGVGSLVWTKLTACPEGLTLDALANSIQVDFRDVPQQQIRRDVESLLNQLNQNGIVQANDGKTELIPGAAKRWFDNVVELLARIAVNLLLKLRLTSIAAFFELTLVDLMLKVGGFRALHRVVKHWPIANKKDLIPEAVQQTSKAVDRAATYYPKHALCLQRSAVAACLLRSHGVPAQMVIACRKIPFKGHAWVEVGGEVVNDNKKVQAFYHSVLERC
ncbi:MAG TPA: lasso peptide biosynthesis B2 protein [Pyrinomonadaceae bacterium]|nr:lasso peptide biosynthesis B2 protein [Pyrinomonadaceae bacterium]